MTIYNREDSRAVLPQLEKKIDELTARVDELQSRDYIVEQSTSGIWTYRKWNSGVAECWGVTPLTNGGVKEKVHAVALPFTFANTSYIVTQAISDVGAGYQYANSNFSVYARYTTELQLNIKCDTNGTNITYNCYLSIHGKWK